MSSSTDKPDIVRTILLEPEPGRLGWIAGNFLFALDVIGGRWLAKRLALHDAPIRCLDFNSETREWLTAADDKQILLLEDSTFTVKHRFKTKKKAADARFADADRFLVTDRFGDIFLLTTAQLCSITKAVAKVLAEHVRRNPNDDTLKANGLLTSTTEGEATENATEGDHDDEDEFDGCAPVAGHCSQVTCMTLSKDRRLLLTGDKDEKLRVARFPECYVTECFCLGHREFLTDALHIKSHVVMSASADRTIRVWDVKHDGEELGQLALEHVPARLIPIEGTEKVLVMCAELAGVLVVNVEIGEREGGLGKVEGTSPLKASITLLKIIELPSCPQAILVSKCPKSSLVGDDAFSSFKGLPTSPEVESAVSHELIWWISRDGRLQLPLSLESGSPVFGTNAWIGTDIGDDVPPAPLHLWKHIRSLGENAESERRAKRLRHSK